MLENFAKLGLALAIGFLIGVERGWKQRAHPEGERAAGLRTFALAGILGGVAALIGEALGGLAFAAIALPFGLAFVAFKLIEARADNDISATGAIAGLATFALGVLAATGPPELAAAAAIAVAATLAFKEALHGWVERLSWAEIRSALLVLAMTFIVLPVLPQGPVDPWGLISPRELWTLTVLIAGASYLGYVALRLFGARAGLVAGAAAAALVSSTVATADLARRVRAGAAGVPDAAAGALAAHAVMLARVAALTGALAPGVLAAAWRALLGAALATAAAAAFAYFHQGLRSAEAPPAAVRNPLDLGAVLQFALILGAFLIAVRLGVRLIGDGAVLPIAAVSGLLDVDAVVMAMASLTGGQDISARLAADAILLAAAADALSKSVIALAAGGPRMGAWFAAGAGLSVLAGLAGRALTP